MNNQNIIITHYVILIEIDAYSKRSLTSCVQNVQKIKNYFNEILNSVHIQLFTAIKSTQLNLYNSVEGLMLWSTYDNVISTFREIISLTKTEDFIYIHYFKHGIQIEFCRKFSNKFTKNLTLILFNEKKKNGERYF